MAIQSTVFNKAMVLEMQAGTDDIGNPIYSRRTFGNLRTTAADADIYDVALAMNSLQSTPLIEVQTREYSTLEDDGL